jgi:hypothetical protein
MEKRSLRMNRYLKYITTLPLMLVLGVCVVAWVLLRNEEYPTTIEWGQEG